MPDLVLIGVSMPEKDGIEVMMLAKEKHPGLKILMLIVIDDEKKPFEALKAGASGYLLKEIKSHFLTNAIDDVLEGGLPLSPLLAGMALKYLKGESKIQDVFSRNEKIKQKGTRSTPMAKKGNVRAADCRLFVYI